MAETLWAQSTGRQISTADRNAISAYLVDNLLAEERGAPADGREEIAQQAVETQGAAVREFPERALFPQRLRASADAQLQSGLIDQETFTAIIFPATPFADVPAEFRASVPASGAATRQAELKALGVVNHFQFNISEILRRSVDEPNVRDFREAVGNLVSAQTDEDIVEGRNLFSAPESASQIRARGRAEGAAELFTKEGNLGRAVEDLLRQSGRAADPSLILDQEDKEAATRAKRMFTERLKQFRSEILAESPGISDEALAGQLADFANSFVESGQFDQLETAVSQAFQAERVSTKSGAEDEVKAIFDQLGLDSDEILPEQLTQLAEIGRQAGGFNEQDVENFRNAFPQFRQARIESEEATTVGEARTVSGARSLLNQALFEAGQNPRDFTPEQLDAMSQFIAQSGGVQDFERVVGPQLEQLKQQKVLQETLGGGRAGGGAQRFGPDNFPTFEELDALRSEGLGVAPTGAIAPLRPGQTQSVANVRGSIVAQLGQGGLAIPFRRDEALPDSEFGPLFAEAAGDSPAFGRFLESQRGNLRSLFRTTRRGEVREERGRLRDIGLEQSKGLGLAREGLRRVAPGGAGEAALRGAEDIFSSQIRGTSLAQRESRSSLTFGTFFGNQLGRLRTEFGQSPAGIEESQRLETKAERDRRRSLRTGRTVFRRI